VRSKKSPRKATDAGRGATNSLAGIIKRVCSITPYFPMYSAKNELSQVPPP